MKNTLLIILFTTTVCILAGEDPEVEKMQKSVAANRIIAELAHSVISRRRNLAVFKSPAERKAEMIHILDELEQLYKTAPHGADGSYSAGSVEITKIDELKLRATALLRMTDPDLIPNLQRGLDYDLSQLQKYMTEYKGVPLTEDTKHAVDLALHPVVAAAQPAQVDKTQRVLFTLTMKDGKKIEAFSSMDAGDVYVLKTAAGMQKVKKDEVDKIDRADDK